MRQAVIPGKTIEVVTPRELRDLLARELRDAPGRNITASKHGQTDGGGRVSIEVYKVPDGMEFELGWLTLEVSGVTFETPVLRDNAGAQVEINGTPRDFVYQAGSVAGTFALQLPYRKEYSSGGAIRIRNGSVLSVRVLYPSGGVVVAAIGGRLYSVPPTERSNS